jgi:hypothetical protein
MPALGAAPNNRIHPHYGVFSPVRGEYVDLVAQAPLPAKALAFDIGVGTGVLSAVLARRGVQRVVATDQDPRALACARDNLQRLGCWRRSAAVQADLFPPRGARRWWCATRPGCRRGQLAHRARGVRRGQPHAARLSGRAGSPPGARRRGLADPVGPGRAPGPAPARQLLGWIAEAGLKVLAAGHRPRHAKAGRRGRCAARRPCGGSHLAVAPGPRVPTRVIRSADPSFPLSEPPRISIALCRRCGPTQCGRCRLPPTYSSRPPATPLTAEEQVVAASRHPGLS